MRLLAAFSDALEAFQSEFGKDYEASTSKVQAAEPAAREDEQDTEPVSWIEDDDGVCLLEEDPSFAFNDNGITGNERTDFNAVVDGERPLFARSQQEQRRVAAAKHSKNVNANCGPALFRRSTSDN